MSVDTEVIGVAKDTPGRGVGSQDGRNIDDIDDRLGAAADERTIVRNWSAPHDPRDADHKCEGGGGGMCNALRKGLLHKSGEVDMWCCHSKRIAMSRCDEKERGSAGVAKMGRVYAELLKFGMPNG